MKILYFSSMIVSPGSGGGNTIFNLLEPCPVGGEVFYATPTAYSPYWAPFPEISSRLCWFPWDRVLPSTRYGKKLVIIKELNALLDRINTRVMRERILRKIIQYIEQLRINLLLLCPQHRVDLSAELMARTGLPTIVWFMDNYYSDQSSISYVRRIWERSQRRFVISEAMQQYFSQFYGGQCEVLNNSVTFSECYPEPIAQSDRLRIAYAGSMHSYYLDSMSMVLKELCGLGDQLTLDVYSYYTLPVDDQFSHDCPVRYFPPIPSQELPRRLQEYDILLFISSFKPEHRAIAETSLASKIADYLAAGRCILAYGPEYSENVRYVKRHGFGEIVTSESGQLREAVLSLARNPERRRELGKRAYYFGRERHNKTTNSARLWQALFQVYGSSRNSCK